MQSEQLGEVEARLHALEAALAGATPPPALQHATSTLSALRGSTLTGDIHSQAFLLGRLEILLSEVESAVRQVEAQRTNTAAVMSAAAVAGQAYLTESEAEVADLWGAALERYEDDISDEERRRFEEARQREQEALANGDMLAALEAREAQLGVLHGIYERNGDEEALESIDRLQRDTQAHRAAVAQEQERTEAAVSARGGPSAAASAEIMTAAEAEEAQDLAAADDLLAGLGFEVADMPDAVPGEQPSQGVPGANKQADERQI
jgi:vacuolar-type H+-ATPase subunit I/STV1